MQVRCHLCGAVMDVEEAVRREMKIGRATGGSSSLGYLADQFGVVNTSSGQSFYGMVDLCQSCNTKQEVKEKERAKREKRDNLIVSCTVATVMAFIIFCLAMVFMRGRAF